MGCMGGIKGEFTMKRGYLKVGVCLAALLAAFALPSYPQVVSATLSGRVTDSSGGVIPKAAVTAVNNATKFSRSTETSDAGEYSLVALPAGEYTVTAEAKGFRAEPKGLVLQVGQTANLDFSLGVGEMKQQVTVEATSEVTEPTRTNVSNVIVERQIENLPVNGRQFIDFALLAPAVQIGDTTSGSTDVIVEPVTKLSFAGQNIHYNFIAVDGADDISTVSGIQRATPSQEAVQEFRVVNSSYTTEFGRAVGGVVNIITKSGTNDWHGSLYDYFRNNELDAKSILQAPGLNVLRQNQFGASLGGPIRKDKTFLFANYEGQRRGESPFYNSVVLANSKPNTPTAANPLGLSNIDFVKVNIFRLPAEPKGLNVLRTGDQDNGFIRVDHNINDRQTLMVRYFVTDGRLTNQSPLNDGFDLPSAFKNNFFRDQSLVGNLTSTFTPTLINELRIQFARRSFDFTTATTQPHLEVSNTFTVGVNRGNPDFYREHRFELVDNVTKNLNKHTLNFGGNYNFVRSQESFPLFYPFEADFANLPAFLGTDGAVPGCATQCPDPFVIFFQRSQAPGFNEPTIIPGGTAIYQGTKIPASIRNQAQATLDHTYTGFFIQDKWRATNKLTINGGLRWEFETWPSGLLDTQWDNFDPRLGLAYSVGTKWNVVVRAGAGLFHGTIPSPLLGDAIPTGGGINGPFPGRANVQVSANAKAREQAFASAPALTNFALNQLLTGATYPDFTTISPFTGTPAGPCIPVSACGFLGDATIVRFVKNHKNPYGEQFSLTVEFEPLKDTNVSITGMHVQGVHLGSFFNINQPPASGTVLVHNSAGVAGCKNVYFANPALLGPAAGGCSNTYPTNFLFGAAGPPGVTCFPGNTFCNGVIYAVYFEATGRWRSSYNGLLVNVNKRFTHHFTYGISYTWAKSIDDGPNPSFVLIPQDSLNIRAERTISADDVRNRFVGNAVLSSPTTGRLWFRDFQFGLILTLQSPQYFTKFAGADVNGDVFGVNDRVGIDNRNTFKGDTLKTLDLRLSRSFAILEKKKIEFIAEAFNVANSVNVRFFNTNYGAADFCPAAGANVCGAGPFFKEGSPNPNFGTPRAVFNPRQIQLALRFTF